MDKSQLYKQALQLFDDNRPHEAIELLHSAGSPDMQPQLLLADIHDRLMEYDKAYPLYVCAAEAKIPYAQLMVATYILRQHDGAKTPNLPKARKLLAASAEGGNAVAMANMGEYYHRGIYGFPKDEQLSLQKYTDAANAGYVPAMTHLGSYYFAGQDKDLQQSLYWYTAAADKGDKLAPKWVKQIHKLLNNRQ